MKIRPFYFVLGLLFGMLVGFVLLVLLFDDTAGAEMSANSSGVSNSAVTQFHDYPNEPTGLLDVKWGTKPENFPVKLKEIKVNSPDKLKEMDYYAFKNDADKRKYALCNGTKAVSLLFLNKAFIGVMYQFNDYESLYTFYNSERTAYGDPTVHDQLNAIWFGKETICMYMLYPAPLYYRVSTKDWVTVRKLRSLKTQ